MWQERQIAAEEQKAKDRARELFKIEKAPRTSSMDLETGLIWFGRSHSATLNLFHCFFWGLAKIKINSLDQAASLLIGSDRES